MHNGQQMPFSLTGCLQSTGGQDSMKHVTWASWGKGLNINTIKKRLKSYIYNIQYIVLILSIITHFLNYISYLFGAAVQYDQTTSCTKHGGYIGNK